MTLGRMQNHLQVFLLATNFKSDAMISHKPDRNFETKLRNETSASEEAECLLAIGKDKK